MEELIRRVLNTLDKIEVKGRDNLDKMLGCMQTLQKVANEMAANNKATEQVKNAQERGVSQ